MKNLTQVHHSSLHNNSWPANHVAWRVMCPTVFVLEYSIACKKLVVEKTCTRLIDIRGCLYMYKTTCTSFWYNVLERVLPALVSVCRYRLLPRVAEQHYDYVTGSDAVVIRWYFGKIKRIEAEKILLQPGNESGAFLIRDSESRRNDFSLSSKLCSID